MAFRMIPIVLVLSFSLLLPCYLAKVICEELPTNLCAFSISSTGHRCILESNPSKQTENLTKYECRTSEIIVDRVSDWIESEECIKSCGVDRNSKGISSDALLDSKFTAMLCSSVCHQSCPNIVDLYFNLAAAEGVFLPDLCRVRRLNSRRSMVDLLSSGYAAGPAAAGSFVADEFAPPPLA